MNVMYMYYILSTYSYTKLYYISDLPDNLPVNLSNVLLHTLCGHIDNLEVANYA